MTIKLNVQQIEDALALIDEFDPTATVSVETLQDLIDFFDDDLSGGLNSGDAVAVNLSLFTKLKVFILEIDPNGEYLSSDLMEQTGFEANSFDLTAQMQGYVEQNSAPELHKPNLDGYLVWTLKDFASRGFGEAFWMLIQENLELSINPNKWQKPGADIGFVVLPDLKAQGLSDTTIIDQWYELITAEMSALQKRIFAPEINRLIRLTAVSCGVQSVGLTPPPQYLTFSILALDLQDSNGTVMAQDADGNEYVQLRFDDQTLATLKNRAANSSIPRLFYEVPVNTLQAPILLARHTFVSDSFWGIKECPNAFGLATADNAIQIVSMGMTQPPPTKTDLFLQVGWTVLSTVGFSAGLYNTARARAYQTATVPLRFPTQDVSNSYVPPQPVAPSPSHTTANSTKAPITLWTNTPIEVDAPPPAKTTSTGPLRLPIPSSSPSGSTISSTPTGGTNSSTGGLETATNTRPAVVVTPTAIPTVTPTSRPSPTNSSNTDTVGPPIYDRFGTNVPARVVQTLQNPTPVVARTVPLPIAEVVPAYDGLPLAATSNSPAPAPLPPRPLGNDSENHPMILPSAETTKFFDAPGSTSTEVMIHPAFDIQDDTIEAPSSENVEGVIGDVPANIDDAYWTKERRSYQQEIVDAVLNRAQRGGDRGIVIVPTGTGKTFTFTESLWELHNLSQYGSKRILVIAHQDEIVRQNANELRRRFGDNVGVMTEGQSDPGTEVVSTTIQTLLAQADSFPWDEFALVTIDEAHHYVPDNSWFEALRRLGFFDVDNQPVNQNGEKFLLGFTATPDRADGQSLIDVFGNDVLYTRDINYFIKNEYLRQPKCIKVDLQGLSRGDPVNNRDAWRLMTMEQKARFLVTLMRETPDLNRDGHLKRTIIYLSSREEVLELEILLNEYGIRAVGILGETEDRSKKLEAFRHGYYDVMLNISVATEGFDAPGTEVVMLLASDKSTRSRVVQMIGRALRTDPEHPDRIYAIIVDFFGLMARHDITMNGEDAYV